MPSKDDDWVELSMSTILSDPTDAQIDACIKAYALGDRFLISNFRRAANNLFAELLPGFYFSDIQGRLSTVYALKNIPSDRVILQNLVDQYCYYWADDSGDYTLSAQNELPRSFLRRVTNRFQELSEASAEEKRRKRCYMEHVSDVEKEDCKALHMRYDEYLDLAYFE